VEDLSEDLELQRIPPGYVDVDAPLHFLDVSSKESSSPQLDSGASLTGKLKALCPLLYYSLSFEEK
jgi:hypothetical protein